MAKNLPEGSISNRGVLIIVRKIPREPSLGALSPNTPSQLSCHRLSYGTSEAGLIASFEVGADVPIPTLPELTTSICADDRQATANRRRAVTENLKKGVVIFIGAKEVAQIAGVHGPGRCSRNPSDEKVTELTNWRPCAAAGGVKSAHCFPGKQIHSAFLAKWPCRLCRPT